MPDPMIDLAAAVLTHHQLLRTPEVICACSWEPEWGRDAHGFWKQYHRHVAEALSHAGLLTWPPPTCQRCHKPVTPTHVTTLGWAESRHCADCLNPPEVPE